MEYSTPSTVGKVIPTREGRLPTLHLHFESRNWDRLRLWNVWCWTLNYGVINCGDCAG
jgi:hypothetical protein